MKTRLLGKLSTVHSAAIYLVANIAIRFTPIVLLPILTRRFTLEEYGIMTAFLATLSIVELVVLMGGADAVIRAYFEREEDLGKFGRYVFNTCLINGFVGLILTVFFLSFLSKLKGSLGIPGPFLLLIPILGFLMALFTYSRKLAVFEKDPIKYSLFSGLYMFFDLGSTLIFIFCFSWSWQGRIAGILVTRLLAGIGSLWHLKNRGFLCLKIDFKVMKESITYGLPVFGHSMGVVSLSSMDRLFLTAYVGSAATGIYGVATSLVGLTSIAVTAFSLVWTPMIFQRLKEAKRENKFYLVSRTYKVVVIMALGMAVFALIVPTILRVAAGEKYQSAQVHLYWLCAAAFFNGLYVAVSAYIFYFKKVKLLAMVSLGMVGVGVILYPALIKMNGPVGAAQANCFIFFLRFLSMAVLGYLVYPLPWLSIFNRRYKP